MLGNAIGTLWRYWQMWTALNPSQSHYWGRSSSSGRSPRGNGPACLTDAHTDMHHCQVCSIGILCIALQTGACIRLGPNMQNVLDACMHVDAAEGRVKDGDIQCAYHGWQYNGKGQCTCIPQVLFSATAPCPPPQTNCAKGSALTHNAGTERAIKLPGPQTASSGMTAQLKKCCVGCTGGGCIGLLQLGGLCGGIPHSDSRWRRLGLA